MGPRRLLEAELAHDARRYAELIDAQEQRWRDDIGRIRTDSAVDRLLGLLPGTPLVTVESAAQLINRSKVVAVNAVNRLCEADVLQQRDLGRRRYRVYEAPGVLRLFTELERSLASPTGDTRTDLPVRPTPARR